MIGRSTYKALDAIFNQSCEVSDGKVVVKAKTRGDCIQNPSDADATYNAHKGRGRGHPLSGTKETWVAAFAPLEVELSYVMNYMAARVTGRSRNAPFSQSGGF